MAPLLVEVKAPFVVFIFYFDLIFRQFNFHNMHEWLNSFHLSEEKNFHNKNLKQEWPFACRPRISHLLYFLLLWLAQLALFWALIQGWIFSSFAVCYQWWPSNLSELQKGFNERARYTLSAWRQSVLVCKASALQIDIRGSPRGEISYVQEFPRIILAWKPMQTFFSWFCIKPALWKQGGPDMFVLSHFGSSPALLLTTHHAGGLCALGSSVPSLSYWAVLHHPAVSYHMVITWMSFQWRR